MKWFWLLAAFLCAVMSAISISLLFFYVADRSSPAFMDVLVISVGVACQLTLTYWALQKFKAG